MAKTTKHPGGRPTVMTESVLNKLQEAFLMDCTDEEACFYAEITPKTLYNYQNANPEYLQKKQQWKQNPVLLARRTVYGQLAENHDMAFKYLERKAKKEFSPKQEVDTSGEVKLTVVYEGRDTEKKDSD